MSNTGPQTNPGLGEDKPPEFNLINLALQNLMEQSLSHSLQLSIRHTVQRQKFMVLLLAQPRMYSLYDPRHTSSASLGLSFLICLMGGSLNLSTMDLWNWIYLCGEAVQGITECLPPTTHQTPRRYIHIYIFLSSQDDSKDAGESRPLGA